MRRHAQFAIVAIIAISLAHLLDPWAWTQLEKPGVYDRDFGRMLRVIGFLPLWLLLAAALWLQTRDHRRALLLALTPALGGLVAEVLKILLRRERPGLHDGEYYFRPYADQFFSTRVLALPSSHALVAFSGTLLLCKLYPRAWPVWLAFGIGCALTRLQAHAHFLSDVIVAGVAAYLTVELVWRRWGRA